ncbi:hypothetical protein A0J61_08870 [Choanephora cucurbitarum]|uniref:Uncharacterized protein n=1 Tax=Choanephora cucurbitarum TaxID=101091 RepID=A0A1C7N1U8_9FUNG|nr:hypothetical protein A0J61_08870 [Choanephora cucurbitarum]
MSKGSYVCQRAAHAIIADVGPLRISSDALQAINMFIDEFLSYLLISASSLDLVCLKTAVTHLLSDSLGKNALAEAEVELKQAIKSKEHDLVLYEKMRLLDNDGFFPVNQAVALAQEACSKYCTLASENVRNSTYTKTMSDYPSKTNSIVITSIVIVFITAVIEHLAEHVLHSIGLAADQSDIENIRVKEVLCAMLDDPQTGSLFARMSLKEKLEKRVGMQYVAPLPSPLASPILPKGYKNFSSCEVNQMPTEERDLQTISSNSSMRSTDSLPARPVSVMSSTTVKSTGSKSRFKLFSNIDTSKDKRGSISHMFSKKSKSSSIISPTSPCFSTESDFEELLRSNSTKRVSLTPTRLKSIEVKNGSATSLAAKHCLSPSDDKVGLQRTDTTKSNGSTSSISSFFLKSCSSPHRTNRDKTYDLNYSVDSLGVSPPIVPTSSLSARPSQRTRRPIQLEDKNIGRPLTKSTPLIEENNISRQSSSASQHSPNRTGSGRIYSRRGVPAPENVILDMRPSKTTQIERPSSMVLKRASMGSRPPSFHEGALEMKGTMEASKVWANLRNQHEPNNNAINNNAENNKLISIKDEEVLVVPSPADKHPKPPSTPTRRSPPLHIPAKSPSRMLHKQKMRNQDCACQAAVIQHKKPQLQVVHVFAYSIQPPEELQ